jgi:integrase
MKKAERRNQPAKGSTIKVEPIMTVNAINKIKSALEDHPRNYCLFIAGINTNLRASDLLQITAGHVRHLRAGDSFELKETKTKKAKRITLNNTVMSAMQRLLTSREYKDTEPLFLGRNGPLTVSSVNRLVKGWCEDAKLKGNYGSHTLRKTFGYMQRTKFGTDLPTLMVMFNHATQKQTLDYLCIQESEIQDAYMNEL